MNLQHAALRRIRTSIIVAALLAGELGIADAHQCLETGAEHDNDNDAAQLLSELVTGLSRLSWLNGTDAVRPFFTEDIWNSASQTVTNLRNARQSTCKVRRTGEPSTIQPDPLLPVWLSRYMHSTVTAMTIGDDRSGPLTSSMVSITSRFLGVTVTFRIC